MDSESVLNNLLVKLFNNILRIEEQALKSSNTLSNLSLTEIHTIEAIGAKEARTMSEVAFDLGITVGTLTTAVNKLIKKEYVQRRRIEEDRRVVMIELTSKGRIAYKVHEKFHHDMIKNILEFLDEGEEKVLISSLEKLAVFFTKKYDTSKLKEK